jgi:hypothetical protein
MTTTNLLHLAVTAATAVLAVWGNLAYRAGRGRAGRAAMRPETAAAAARVLLDYNGSERLRFQLVNTMLATAAGSLLVPMVLGGWNRPVPTGLVFVGLGCLVLALVWLVDFALRPLPDPTQRRRLSVRSVEDGR